MRILNWQHIIGFITGFKGVCTVSATTYTAVGIPQAVTWLDILKALIIPAIVIIYLYYYSSTRKKEQDKKRNQPPKKWD